jgi:hypothetical protein
VKHYGAGLRQERLEYSELVTKSDLYIEITTEKWIPLYPFITVHNCPRCKSREIYFIDKYDNKKNKSIKF